MTDQWGVQRKADQKVMRDGFKNEQDARGYITADLTTRSVGR
jgi:hypothetical protein